MDKVIFVFSNILPNHKAKDLENLILYSAIANFCFSMIESFTIQKNLISNFLSLLISFSNISIIIIICIAAVIIVNRQKNVINHELNGFGFILCIIGICISFSSFLIKATLFSKLMALSFNDVQLFKFTSLPLVIFCFLTNVFSCFIWLGHIMFWFCDLIRIFVKTDDSIVNFARIKESNNQFNTIRNFTNNLGNDVEEIEILKGKNDTTPMGNEKIPVNTNDDENDMINDSKNKRNNTKEEEDN